MAYTKRIICLANSYKKNGRCIAGKDINSGEWIRPVSERSTEELSFFEYCYEGYKDPKLLDIIDVPLVKAAPHNHQSENHVIKKERWVKHGTLPWADLGQLRDRPESLWANTESTKGGGRFNCISPEIAAQYDYSLLLIKRKRLTVLVASSTWEGRTTKSYRGRFKYKDVEYIFNITDPVAREVFEAKDVGEYALNDVCLCLSLTERFEEDGRCHKLIAAVLTNPPL